MNVTSKLLILWVLVAFSIQEGSSQSRDIVAGKAYEIHSTLLDEDRELQIGLPWNYESSSCSYPVLYILDGWDYSFKFTQAVVEFLVENSRIPEMIVVGVNNTNRDRDFTPTEFNETSTGEFAEYNQSGGAENFIRFLEEELKSHIDTTYRTLEFEIIVGHSLGGLLTSYMMLERPSLFNAYIHLSPSIWWDNKLLVNQSERNLKKWKSGNPTFVYYGYELERDSTSIHQESTEELIMKIKEHQPQSMVLKTGFKPEETHNSLVLRSTYEALEFIFESYSLPHNGDILELIEPEQIKRHFEAASQNLGYQVPIPEWYLNRTASFYDYYENFSMALAASKLFVEKYPNSELAYYNLGEAYFKLDDRNKAIEAFKKVLDIAPGHEEAIKRLSELSK